MLQTTSTHKQFEILALAFLAGRPDIPHTWRKIKDIAGGRTDLIFWPGTPTEIFASLTDYQITVGTREKDEDFEIFGRNINDDGLAREALSALKSLINTRLPDDS